MRKIKPQENKIGMPMEKSEPSYPKIRIDLTHIPEAKDWKIGESYEVDMMLKMVGLSISKYDNSAEFEIKEIEPEEEENDEPKSAAQKINKVIG